MCAPLDLAEKCIALIDREGEHARQGKEARIMAKRMRCSTRTLFRR